MLKVGVLGANGFVGSRLTEIFHLNNEFEVIPIAHSFAGLARIARFAPNWRIADATNPVELAEAFRDCDVVVHAIAGSLESIVKSPKVTLEAIKRARVGRLIYISTASVHGQNPEPGTNENSPLHTKHAVPYNNAKVLAERFFIANYKSADVKLIVLRPGIVFGPRDVWITGIGRALAEGSAYLVDGGVGYCNTIYVDNLVHAIRCSITATINGEVFLVGDSEVISWKELYGKVAAALGYADEIPSVNVPHNSASGISAIDRVKLVPGVQEILDRIPRRAKAVGRIPFEIVSEVQSGVGRALNKKPQNHWVRRERLQPKVSEETAELHRCRHHFDYSKARQLLGYIAPVSLEEGIRRSVGWLEFIGLVAAKGDGSLLYESAKK
jgi:nucleoside-diphosphate-sugar epimerase